MVRIGSRWQEVNGYRYNRVFLVVATTLTHVYVKNEKTGYHTNKPLRYWYSLHHQLLSNAIVGGLK